MTDHRELTRQEFLQCFKAPMVDVTKEADAAVDIRSYVEALDLDALGLPHLNGVKHVYRDADARYDQVLIGTGRFNALLMIVVDRAQRKVFGHHLLNLNDEYGVRGGHLREIREPR